MPFPRREYTMPPGYNSKAAIRILAKQQTSAWLGISGEKVRQQMQGGDDGAIDYAEIRRKLHAALLRGQQNMQVIVGTPQINHSEDQNYHARTAYWHFHYTEYPRAGCR